MIPPKPPTQPSAPPAACCACAGRGSRAGACSATQPCTLSLTLSGLRIPRRARVPCRHLIYHEATHACFIMRWPLLQKPPLSKLPPSLLVPAPKQLGIVQDPQDPQDPLVVVRGSEQELGALGTEQCQTVPNSAGHCQTVPSSGGNCQTVPNSAGTCQTVQNSAGNCRTVPDSAGQCQAVPHGRLLQGVGQQDEGPGASSSKSHGASGSTGPQGLRRIDAHGLCAQRRWRGATEGLPPFARDLCAIVLGLADGEGLLAQRLASKL